MSSASKIETGIFGAMILPGTNVAQGKCASKKLEKGDRRLLFLNFRQLAYKIAFLNFKILDVSGRRRLLKI